MNEPTEQQIEFRITGPRLREKRPCNNPCYINGEKLVYVWPTTHGNLTIPEMSEITGIKIMTIYTRMDRYGYDHPDVFEKKNLVRGNGKNYGAMPSGKAKKTIDQVGGGTWEAANL